MLLFGFVVNILNHCSFVVFIYLFVFVCVFWFVCLDSESQLISVAMACALVHGIKDIGWPLTQAFEQVLHLITYAKHMMLRWRLSKSHSSSQDQQ